MAGLYFVYKSQDRMPIVFYNRSAIQAEAKRWLFFFFFFFCLSAQHPQSDRVYPRSIQYCNRVCIWMFLVRYIVTGCIFRAPSAIWQGQVLSPPAAPPSPVEKSSAPPPPPRDLNSSSIEHFDINTGYTIQIKHTGYTEIALIIFQYNVDELQIY